MQENFTDSSFFALNRVIDVIYRDEEDIGDILFFIVSLAVKSWAPGEAPSGFWSREPSI
jgi:hypothetical protein